MIPKNIATSLARIMHVNTETKPFVMYLAWFLANSRGHRVLPRKDLDDTTETHSGIYFRDEYSIYEYQLNGSTVANRFSFREYTGEYDSKKPISHTEVVFDRWDVHGEYLDFPISMLRNGGTDGNETHKASHRLLWEIAKPSTFNYIIPDNYALALESLLFDMGDIFGPPLNSTGYHLKLEGFKATLFHVKVTARKEDRKTGGFSYCMTPLSATVMEFGFDFTTPKTTQNATFDGSDIIVDEFTPIYNENNMITKLFK